MDGAGTIPGFDFVGELAGTSVRASDNRQQYEAAASTAAPTIKELDQEDIELYSSSTNPLEEYLVSEEEGEEQEYPPQYAKLRGYGATELVAEKLFELIEAKFFPEGEINEQCARNICKRSQTDEDGMVSIIEDFRTTEFLDTDDRQHVLRIMFKRYSRGLRNVRANHIEPLPTAAQLRIDAFYASEATKGYKLLVTGGARRFCKESCQQDDILDSHQVFIGRIPKDLYEDELVTYFSKIGRIDSLCLMMDTASNTNRGFAFLNYEDRSLAAAAAEQLDQSYIRLNKRIGVRICEETGSSRLFIGGLPRDKTKEEFLVKFREIFEGVEDLIMYTDSIDKTRNRGFVFIDFKDRRSAVIARKLSMKGTAKVFDKVITNADWARVLDREEEEVNTDTIKKLFIRGLAESTKQEHIYLAFITYGEVELIKKQADYAFVHFVRREDAKRAIENPPKEIDGQSGFTVRYAMPRKKKFNNFNRLNERSNGKGNMERYIPPGYSDPDPNWIEPTEYQRRKREGTLPSHHYNKPERQDHNTERRDGERRDGRRHHYERDPVQEKIHQYQQEQAGSNEGKQYGYKSNYRGDPLNDYKNPNNKHHSILQDKDGLNERSKGKDKRRRRSSSSQSDERGSGWAWSTGRTNVTHGSFSNIPMTPHTVKGSANFETNLADELLEKKKADILSFFDIKEVRDPEKVKKKREDSERRERKHRSHSTSKKRRHSSRSESRTESHREERAKFKLPVEHESQRQKYHLMQKIAKRKAAVLPALYPKGPVQPARKPAALLATPDYNPAAAQYNPNTRSSQPFDEGYSFKDGLSQSFAGHNQNRAAQSSSRTHHTYNQNPNNSDRQYNPNSRQPILPLPTLDYQNISPPPHDDFNPNDFEFEDYDEHNRPVENNYQHAESPPQFGEGYSFKDGLSQHFTGHNQNHTGQSHNQYYDQHGSDQYQDEPAHYVEPSYDPGTYVDPNKFYRLDGGVKSNLSNHSVAHGGARWQ